MHELNARVTAKLPPQAQSLNAMIEQCLERNPLRLSFPPLLEERYQLHTQASNCRQLIWTGVMAILFYCSFVVVDLIYRPELIVPLLRVRFGVVSICLLALTIVLLYRQNTRLPGWLSLVGVVAAAVSGGLMLSMPGNPIVRFEPYTFLLVAIVGNIALPLRFSQAVIAGIANVALASAFILETPGLNAQEQASPLIFLAATTVLTLFANFRLESSDRKAYLFYLREKLYADALASEFRSLDRISQTDHLTGIANRRQFDDFLERHWELARAENDRLALLMIDIDHFKAYNDTYGHVAGDDCLVRVAGLIKDSVRSNSDLAARFGGEEFAIILPGGNEDVAVSLAARIHAKVAALEIEHRASPTNRLTVSVGIAVTRPATTNHDARHLLQRADQALYNAKGEGRDRTSASERNMDGRRNQA